jgi:two-component system sensor histidine kinase MprB
MSLRWRISIALATLAMGAATLAALGAYFATADQLSSAFDRSLSARTTELGGGPQPAVSEGDRDAEVVTTEGCPPDGLIEPAEAAQIVRPDGTIDVCLPDGPILPARTAPSQGAVALSDASVDGRDLRIATTAFHGGGTLMVARDPGDQLEVLGELRQRLVAMVAAVSCLAGVVGWFVARRLVRPLIRLRDAARSISRTGDLTTPLVVDGSGEVRDLATSIDEMVQSLASSRTQQQRLVSDASHEMRTPLTSLTTNLDLLDRYGELSPDDRPEVVSAVRCDVDELTHLVTELVELATDRSSDEPVQLVDLAELATAVADRVRRRSGRVITLVVESEGLVVARPVMVERAIANLVDNAVKYSPATSPIEVRVGRSTVEVLDRGPGIPEELVDRIFERFYRTPEARGRPGSGLGLAIVQQVIERHGGTVWARPRDGGGLVVGFELAPPTPL